MTPGDFFQRDRGLHPPALAPGYKSSVLRSPRQALLSLDQGLSERTGPAFGHGDIAPGDSDLLTNFNQGGDPVGRDGFARAGGHIVERRHGPELGARSPTFNPSIFQCGRAIWR
jgi:hypothetical protein